MQPIQNMAHRPFLNLMNSRIIPLILVMIGLVVAFAPLPVQSIAPQGRTFQIEARQFAYSPSKLKVNPGDTVTLQLVSTDVVHGLYIDGYDVSVEADPGQSANNGRPVDFTDAKRMLGASPVLLQGKILRGGMGTGMPMWGSIFTDEQIWDLIAYLYSFQFEYNK